MRTVPLFAAVLLAAACADTPPARPSFPPADPAARPAAAGSCEWFAESGLVTPPDCRPDHAVRARVERNAAGERPRMEARDRAAAECRLQALAMARQAAAPYGVDLVGSALARPVYDAAWREAFTLCMEARAPR